MTHFTPPSSATFFVKISVVLAKSIAFYNWISHLLHHYTNICNAPYEELIPPRPSNYLEPCSQKVLTRKGLRSRLKSTLFCMLLSPPTCHLNPTTLHPNVSTWNRTRPLSWTMSIPSSDYAIANGRLYFAATRKSDRQRHSVQGGEHRKYYATYR
jgi:hypothetical protein